MSRAEPAETAGGAGAVSGAVPAGNFISILKFFWHTDFETFSFLLLKGIVKF